MQLQRFVILMRNRARVLWTGTDPKHYGNADQMMAGAISGIVTSSFVCGYCSSKVSTNVGYDAISTSEANSITPTEMYNPNVVASIRICPECRCPTLLDKDGQFPETAPGEQVKGVSDSILALYEEGRQCIAVSAYTAAAMVFRKILMHVAVEEEAEKGKSFGFYVQYLLDNHLITARSKNWVDSIRQKGNEVNHEIATATKEEATELLQFVAMLLRTLYEYPAMAPAPPSGT